MHLGILSTLSCLTSGLHCDVVHLVGLSCIDACTAAVPLKWWVSHAASLLDHTVSPHIAGTDPLKSAPKQQLSGHFEQDL